MKKTILLLLVFVAPFTYKSVNAQAVPDSAFSIWTHNAFPAYDDPNSTPLSGDGWQELNFLSQFIFGSSPVSVFEDASIFNSAPYSARITTVALSAATITLLGSGTLPNDSIGILFVGTIAGIKITSGYPYTNRTASLNFYYQYTPTGTDTASAYVVLTKWNTNTNKSDTVAGGLVRITSAVSSWTQGTVPFTYTPNFQASGNPDTAQILFSSSTFTHKKANPGSTFWVDDVTWGPPYVPTATNQILTKSERVSVFPNPASNSATFSFTGNKSHFLNIFDITGKKITGFEVKNNTFALNTEAFSGGLYIYQVMDTSGSIVQTGKLSIVK